MFDKYLIGKRKGEQRDWNIVVTATKGVRNVVVSADNEEDAVQIALRKNMIKNSELDLVSAIVLKGADQYEPSDNGKDDCLSYRATFEDVKKAEKEIKSLKKKGYVITHFTEYTKENQEPWWEIEADMPPTPKEITKDSVKYKNELTMAEPLKPIKASLKYGQCKVGDKCKTVENGPELEVMEVMDETHVKVRMADMPESKGTIYHIGELIQAKEIKAVGEEVPEEMPPLPDEIIDPPKQAMPVPEGVEEPAVEETPVEKVEPEPSPTDIKETVYKVSVNKTVEYENGKVKRTDVDFTSDSIDEAMLQEIMQKVEASNVKAEDIEAFAETYYILREDAPNSPAQWDIIKTDKGYAVYRKGKRSNNAFAGDFTATEMEKLFEKGWESMAKAETVAEPEPMVASAEIVAEPVVEPITAGEETNEIKIKRLNKIDSVMQEQAKLIDLYYNPVRGQDQKVITAKIEELAKVMEGLQDGSIKITAEPAPMVAPNKDQAPAEPTGQQTATNEPASGVAEAPKKDSFDITDGIALGDGYIAQKDAEKDEIYVMDKSGQEVFRAPKKGFVDDVASLVDTLRGILHIQGEIPAEGETAPAPAEGAPAEAPVAEGQPEGEAKPDTVDEQISQIYDKIDELYDMQVQKEEPKDEEKKEEETQNVAELAELKKEIDQKKTEIDKTLKSLMDNKQIMINRKDIQAFILAGENPLFAKKKAMQDKLRRLAKKMYAMDMATIRTIQDVLVGKKDKGNNSDAFMFLNE